MFVENAGMFWVEVAYSPWHAKGLLQKQWQYSNCNRIFMSLLQERHRLSVYRLPFLPVYGVFPDKQKGNLIGSVCSLRTTGVSFDWWP